MCAPAAPCWACVCTRARSMSLTAWTQGSTPCWRSSHSSTCWQLRWAGWMAWCSSRMCDPAVRIPLCAGCALSFAFACALALGHHEHHNPGASARPQVFAGLRATPPDFAVYSMCCEICCMRHASHHIQAGVMTAKGGVQKGSHLQEETFVEFSKVGNCYPATCCSAKSKGWCKFCLSISARAGMQPCS